MKTSEFIRKIEGMGYSALWTDLWIEVQTKRGYVVATVFKRSDKIHLNTTHMQLIKLCVEYAETPIEEREEVKKYRVRIPDSPERTPVYALCKLVNGLVVINQTNESNFQLQPRYHLTESEIKKNHEYLWQFAKEVKE